MLLVDKEACTIKARHIFILMIYREGVMEFAYELPMFILMSGRVWWGACLWTTNFYTDDREGVMGFLLTNHPFLYWWQGGCDGVLADEPSAGLSHLWPGWGVWSAGKPDQRCSHLYSSEFACLTVQVQLHGSVFVVSVVCQLGWENPVPCMRVKCLWDPSALPIYVRDPLAA